MEPESVEEQGINFVNEYPEGYNKNKDFTSLDAWKRARKVKLFFYKQVLPNLPYEEKYKLGGQIRDAAITSTANIADGYGRFHFQEGIQFYRIARGSLSELKDHLISCFDLDYVDKQLLDEGLTLIEETKIKLNGFIGYIKKKQMKS